MRITDRIPPFKRAKSLWSTRPRRVEELAILAGRVAADAVPQDNMDPRAREKGFKRGVHRFYEQTAQMRSTLTRFTTTPDWEARHAAGLSAHELLK